MGAARDHAELRGCVKGEGNIPAIHPPKPLASGEGAHLAAIPHHSFTGKYHFPSRLKNSSYCGKASDMIFSSCGPRTAIWS